MLIYNTSFHVDGEAMLRHFLTHMRDEYLPHVTDGGYLSNPQFVRLLTDVGEGISGYALMCEVADAKTLKKWKDEVGNALNSSFHQKFGEKVLCFSTTMRKVEF